MEKFDPTRLLPALLGGLIVGIVLVILSISFAMLVFSGDLSPYAPAGIGLALFTAVVMAGVIALTSSFAGMIATPQDVPAAITALLAASVAAALPAATDPDAVLATVVVAIALTSLSTGAFFLALGFFKLGGLIRFIPYPVIGGFLAGTGWLLVRGSFSVLTGVSLSLGNLSQLLQFDSAVRWLPGLAFSIVLLLASRRIRRSIVLPAMLLGAIAVFYAFLAATGTPVAEATARGWLMGAFPDADLWKPLDPSTLLQVRWGVILHQIKGMLAVPVVGVVALLLNASALELVVNRDIDLDRELRGAGLANLLSGLGGGLVGFQTLAVSTLGHRLAPANRLVGLIAASVCAVSLLLGSSLLSLFPLPVLGGLLLFLGLAFLVEWTYDAWFKLPKADYFVVLLILLVIATVGFLESVGVGIVIAAILFVVNYSRINVVKHALSGATYHSNVQRPGGHTRLLRDQGDQLFILQLQGFIFFGTANNLLERVRRRIEQAELCPVRYAVLDFRLVSGVDSSAVLSFVKMRQLGEGGELALVFADASAAIRSQLEREGPDRSEGASVSWFPELDRAVQWCEDQILESHGMALQGDEMALAERLEQMLPGLSSPDRLMRYLERMEVPERHYLMRQGDPPDELYFIESGQVTAQLELGHQQTLRLLTMGAGTVVGEMEVYLDRPRAASVVTEIPSTVYRLSVRALAQMESEQPEIAVAFHRFIARLLADRVTGNHKTLQALLG